MYIKICNNKLPVVPVLGCFYIILCYITLYYIMLHYIILYYIILYYHHHHVQEGLGLIPVPCILKMKLVPPSLPRSSYVSSSFWFIL